MPWSQQLKEFPVLLWTRVSVGFKSTLEYARVVFRYYGNGSFARADLALLRRYVWQNPYRMCRDFLRERGEADIYTYGETPLTSLELIVRRCGLKAQDTVVELGCGRGRTCLWLSYFVGCRVVGVDYVPQFIEKAIQVKEALHLEKVTFLCEEMERVDFKEATVVYLFGTCLEESFLVDLAKKMEALPEGAKVITVSYALSDYSESGAFELMNRFSAPFTFGTADVYLQVRK